MERDVEVDRALPTPNAVPRVYEVADQLGEGCRLAAMEWEDFEHLIREVFEKEFATSGGEVKVTQASRDGGVDAIALDPHPIRGGNIVIQAEHYTNTVSVSAAGRPLQLLSQAHYHSQQGPEKC